MRSLTKKELVKAAGVSARTFRRWLATPYMQKRLKPFGLKKQQHILPPEVVEIITEHYVIDIA